jgi:hypothetical protein
MRPGDGRIIINENINASSGFTASFHSQFLSPKTGWLPRPLASMLGCWRHRHRYLADNILCNRGDSIQQLVRKYYRNDFKLGGRRFGGRAPLGRIAIACARDA